MKNKLAKMIILVSSLLLAGCGSQKAINYYVVSFDTNGGSSLRDVVVKEGEKLNRPEDPIKEGHDFSGWYINENLLGNEFDFNISINQNYKLFAKWTSTIYHTVTFISNGGSTVDSISVKEGETVPVPNPPTRKGYDFIDWYKDKYFQYKYSFNEAISENLVLYAKWSDPIEYQISYHNVFEEEHSNPSSYNVNTPKINFEDAYRLGYTFLGWYGDSSFEHRITCFGGGDTSNLDVYAKWSNPIEYEITYESDGGTHLNPSTYTVNSDFDLIDASKKYYDFKGWYTLETFEISSKITHIGPNEIGDISLYAYFTPTQYSITYELNQGSEPSLPNPTSYTVLDYVTINDPTKVGYNFVGWYLDNDFTQVFDDTMWSPGKKHENLTLYAKWSNPIEYEITYESDGGTHVNPLSYNVNSDFDLTDATRDYCDFNGWYSSSTFEDEYKVTHIGPNEVGDITLYAYFTWTHYSIGYELNGGSEPSVPNPTSYTVIDEVTIIDPTKTGYNFIGWYLDESLTQPLDKSSWGAFEKHENLYLYAKWSEPIQFSITYHNIVETDINPNPSTFTYFDEVQFEVPSRLNSIFRGWYWESTFENEATSIPAGTLTNKEVYAKWEEIKDLDEYTWNEIKAISNRGEIELYFDIGDTKKVQLKHQDLNSNNVIDEGEVYQTVRIIDFDHDVNSEDETLGITFEFADLISDENGYSLATFWNGTSALDRRNIDFRSATIRAALNSEDEAPNNKWYAINQNNPSSTYKQSVYQMLPDDLASIIETTKKYTPVYGDSWTEESFDDKLFLLSLKEMGEQPDAIEEQCFVYEYYKNAATENSLRIKAQIKGSVGARTERLRGLDVSPDGISSAGYHHGDGSYYWIRSPYPRNFYSAYYIFDTGGKGYMSVDTNAMSVAPCFSIK